MNLTIFSADRHITDCINKSAQNFIAFNVEVAENINATGIDAIILEHDGNEARLCEIIATGLARNKAILVLVKSRDTKDLSNSFRKKYEFDQVYVDYYDNDNLCFIISDFIYHVCHIKKRLGKLIVIDGGNGSGKTTQVEMLTTYLKNQNKNVRHVDFPQYYSSFYGRIVAQFLRGEFGTVDEVSPYLVSLAYAADRASIKRVLENYLDEDVIVIANRYATSNMAHQGAKLESHLRDDYLRWVFELEYKVNKIPQEDIVIYLHVPWHISKTLIERKGERHYLNGATKDIEERASDYQIEAEKMYLNLAKKFKHWKTIECVKDKVLLPPEDVHSSILGVLKEKKII